jgi:predicted permease
VAQIALAVVTLSSSALVVRSLVKLQRVNLAFDSDRLLVVSLAMNPDRLSDAQKQRVALDALAASLRTLHDVRAVTPVAAIPFIGDGGGVDGRLSTVNQGKEESAANPVVNMEVAAPNYFSMLGISLLRGRAFTEQDREGSSKVIIVSSSVAKHFWPGQDPVGMQLADLPEKYTVVGVVPDTRYREVQVARPTVYYPVSQWPDVPSTLLIRTSGAPDEVTPAMRRMVGEAHLGLSVVSAASLETLLDGPRAQPRLNAIVFTLFAIAAVLLAGVGLFAIIATMVRQRTHELGIRMALGATSARIRSVVMLRGLSLALAGTVIGIAGALATRRLISALLFEIGPTDVLTFLGVATLMLAVAAAASILPARAGMRIDPTIALRIEG